MSSRDNILATVKQNQPAAVQLPPIINYDQQYEDVVQKYAEVLRFIGGEVHMVEDLNQVANIIKGNFTHAKRILSTLEQLSQVAEVNVTVTDPHDLYDVDLFVTTASLAVAENGAVWVNADNLP